MKNRLFLQRYAVLVGLIAVFAVPLMSAWLLYQYGGRFIHHTTNHGHLIKPPVAMEDAGFVLDDIVKHRAKWRGQWLIIYIANNECDVLCERNLYLLRQIRLAVGAERERITRVIAIPKSISNLAHLQHLITTDYAGTDVIHVHPRLTAILKRNRIYFADPNGLLMMRYAPDADPMDIFKDMKRLLRR